MTYQASASLTSGSLMIGLTGGASAAVRGALGISGAGGANGALGRAQAVLQREVGGWIWRAPNEAGEAPIPRKDGSLSMEIEEEEWSRALLTDYRDETTTPRSTWNVLADLGTAKPDASKLVTKSWLGSSVNDSIRVARWDRSSSAAGSSTSSAG